ncbi:MAG: peptidoglycan DD-metalloendopeptidase family protein [Oscillospiraceae bacterium]|nr:peptidoglycan DD-metalloendopeptidase family protein [Oscillospiraceae bacterium]
MKNKRVRLSAIVLVLICGLLLGLSSDFLPTNANAASSSAIKEQIEQLEKEQAELEDKLDDLRDQQDENASEIRAIMDQKNVIDQQIGLLYTQISNINEQISAYSVLIADKQEELDDAEKRLKELNEKHKERIRAMEENGELSYWSVLFEANSFSDFLDRLTMMEEIAAADSRRMKEIREAALEVEAAKAELTAERDELKVAKDELAATQAELEEKAAKAQELLEELLAKGEEYEALMEELEEEQEAMTDELANKKVEYDEAKYREHMATAPKPTQPAGNGNGGTPTKDELGKTWVIPCDYTMVTSPFGWRIHPISGVEKFHNGVDLWCMGIYGKPIYATREGVVSYTGWYGSGGWTVMIDHLDGFKSIYMHMTNFIVSEGDFVTAGQVIGYVGDSGGTTGPHLHFELRYNGAAVNPMNYIG